MAFAVTVVEAYGIEVEEALNKRYIQYLNLTITAANTDTDWDLGDNVTGSLGTFWTAADGTATGLTALGAIQDIETRARASVGYSLSAPNFYQGGSASGVVYTAAANTSGKTPNLTFASGSAPTEITIQLRWILQPQQEPVEVYAAA